MKFAGLISISSGCSLITFIIIGSSLLTFIIIGSSLLTFIIIGSSLLTFIIIGSSLLTFIIIGSYVYSQWKDVPGLVITGPAPSSVDRLPIFSLVFNHPETGKLLHHNFICSILSDLFGIQARGGCSCAGPYAQVA